MNYKQWLQHYFYKEEDVSFWRGDHNSRSRREGKIFWSATCTKLCTHYLSNLPWTGGDFSFDTIKISFGCCVLLSRGTWIPFLINLSHALVISLTIFFSFMMLIWESQLLTIYQTRFTYEIMFSLIGFVSADFAWFALHSVVNDLCMYLTKHWSKYGSQTNTDTLPSSSSFTAISSAGNSVCMNMILHAWLGFLHGCYKCASLYTLLLEVRSWYPQWCYWMSPLLLLHCQLDLCPVYPK